ncbi:TonB-linked outer membrane protein, SusC/RagA family [Fodinibius roseus]|uniref:TonB-linked outer membrane protein, SusC/RagA family n=1 Tax=Fodinibius roseus TaxID=1194090 RepID=A0A1M5AML0_9BACT|nr:SusC/RagA family TonB-linked outer membrane protein [Fodinibius roseus]SHF31473.1 TonB-linked outer membrane protein, SusC/RagA family [Fodinibius roseus]
MFRKLLYAVIVCLISAGTAFAQTGSLSGTVTDASSGETLPGVNVFLPELDRGTATNAQGEYTIEDIEYGTYTIRVTYVGYATVEQEITVDQGTVTLDFALTSELQELDDVIVTAYGIEQNLNELPYSAQQVSGETISESRTSNFITSLSGRVAGLKISNNNGMGGSTNIVMRGYKSISGNNQVLFVVDGVPYANEEFNTDDVEEGFAGYDYGNTGVDINPDNIESVNVMKGPAAAALYGSRAANGAIVIQTKAGNKGRRPVEVTFNTGVEVSRMDPSTFVDHQMEYGAGYYGAEGYIYESLGLSGFGESDINGDGEDELIGNYFDDSSFGPRFDPNTEVYQWDAFVEGSPNFGQPTPWVAPKNTPKDFFETGTNFSNSIQINGGFEGGYYNMGYSQNNTTGIMPNSKLDKNKLNFAAGYDVSDRLQVSGKIQYSRTDGRARPATGYSTTLSMFRQWWATNIDIAQQRQAYFRNRTNETWNWASGQAGEQPIYWNNVYWQRYENFQTDLRDRYFGYVEANYEISNWLGVTGRVSLDSYQQRIEERNNKTSVGHGGDDPELKGYRQRNQSFAEYNYDLLANYDKQLSEKVNIDGVVGMNIRRNHKVGITAETNGGLVVPSLYSLDNSVNQILYPEETDEQVGVNGYFASFNINYDELAYLEATGRRDKSSSLPEGENVYYYPSVSAGLNFSEFIEADWLTFGKLRGSWAEVGNTAPPHSILDTYDRPSNFGSAGLYTLPNTKNNPTLKPERTKSWEIGLQMELFNNRFSYDVNYYDQNTLNQILATEVSRSTGYAFKYVNAGNVENRGWEVTATGRPIVTQDFSWVITANWNKNINKVKSLAPDIDNYQLGAPQGDVTISAAIGQAYGAIRGGDFISSIDGNGDGELNDSWSEYGGRRLINPETGFYQMTSTSNNIIGNSNPDWTGGVSNRLNYKNWSLNFLVDVQWGGDIFSLDQYYGQATGQYPVTAGLNDLGNPKRDPVADGGGVILEGVLPDGSENDVRAEAGSILGAYGYVTNPAANFIYDGSYVKLREIGLSYSLPQNLVDKIGVIRGASLSAIGRNLWIIHKNLPHADPEQGIAAGNVQGYQGAAHPSTRNMTFNLKLQF